MHEPCASCFESLVSQVCVRYVRYVRVCVVKADIAAQLNLSYVSDRKPRHNDCAAITHSPTHPLTHSPTHPLTHSPTHPRTHAPTHPLTHWMPSLTFLGKKGMLDGEGCDDASSSQHFASKTDGILNIDFRKKTNEWVSAEDCKFWTFFRILENCYLVPRELLLGLTELLAVLLSFSFDSSLATIIFFTLCPVRMS